MSRTPKPKVTVDSLPPYKVYGRYVCDWKLTESHLFNNAKDARVFARQWGRDCSIGWLPPVYDRRTGRNRKATAFEAKGYISRSVVVHDHREGATDPAGASS